MTPLPAGHLCRPGEAFEEGAQHPRRLLRKLIDKKVSPGSVCAATFRNRFRQAAPTLKNRCRAPSPLQRASIGYAAMLADIGGVALEVDGGGGPFPAPT